MIKTKPMSAKKEVSSLEIKIRAKPNITLLISYGFISIHPPPLLYLIIPYRVFYK
jgi:hypothetical protein